jgi:uncharacterized protein YndB with AHSA1/START domain
VTAPPPGEPVVVERRVNAPPSTVYTLLTQLDRWLAWQEPGAMVDPQPGGPFRMRVAGKAWASGHFVELVQDRLVVLSWGWESADYPVPPGSTRVQIDLIPDGEGTLVRLPYTGLPPGMRDEHKLGWTFHLRQVDWLTGGQVSIED